MTSAGSDNWFGNALSGSDGTADPVVKHRGDHVWSDPTAAPPATQSLEPIVLPPLHLQANRAQIEALVDVDDQPAPRRPPPPRPPPPRPTATPAVRPTSPRPPSAAHAPPPAPTPPVQQWAPPTNPQGAPGPSPWAGTQLPASVTTFLAGVQQHLPQQQQQGLHQLTQRLQQQQAPRPPQQVRRGSSVAGCFTVLFIVGLVLLVSGAGEQLFEVFEDLFRR